ncbi:MAG: ATP-binding protein [Myxococcaceae bacterium]
MRLRTRLALFFAPLAIVPLALVVPSTVRDLRHTLLEELTARIQRTAVSAQATVQQTRTETERAITELASSDALAEVAQDVHQQRNPVGVKSAAEQLMKARGLNVLSLLDDAGTVISSGHVPARLGDQDPTLSKLIRERPAHAVPLWVEVASEEGVTQKPALVFAEPMEYGELRIWVVGGVLLDEAFANRLGALTSAKVQLEGANGLVAQAGDAQPPTVERVLQLSPDLRLRLEFSRAASIKAERGLVISFATVVGIGLVLAILSVLVLTPRLTRPIESLTAGVRRIGQGEMNFKVEEHGSGEVGELVTAFNRMTGELKRTTEQLVASERIAAWQEVARRLAHEIKNPLTPIRMSLETLIAAQKAQSPKFNALFQESAGAVIEEVDRLRRIVDEFSQFARMPKPRLETAELSELTSQALSLYGSLPEGVRLHTELAPSLGVKVDPDQLTQILVNLVKNAIEVLPKGGDIWVRTRRVQHHAVIEVEDSGPGIRPEHRARIFEPYFTTKEGGTGLGLAIAARICQEHGGGLDVDAGTEGTGALFRVRLPVARGLRSS